MKSLFLKSGQIWLHEPLVFGARTRKDQGTSNDFGNAERTEKQGMISFFGCFLFFFASVILFFS